MRVERIASDHARSHEIARDRASPEPPARVHYWQVRAAYSKWRKTQEKAKAEGEEEDFLASMVGDEEEEDEDEGAKSKEEL